MMRGEKAFELTTSAGDRDAVSEATLLAGQVDCRIYDAVAHLAYVRKDVEDVHGHLRAAAGDMIRGGPESRVSYSMRVSR